MVEEEIAFKILILGNSNVGKTSFILRYCEDKFEEILVSTSGIDIKNKIIKRHNKVINLKIFDTAGQERYHSISKNYFNMADGIIIIYDISNEESFKAIKEWIESIKEVIEIREIGIIIVGNKSDIPDEERQVNNLMKEELEKELNINVLEVSTKNNINIEKCFEKLVDKIYEIQYGIKANETLRKTNSIKLDKNHNKKRKKHICCKKE